MRVTKESTIYNHVSVNRHGVKVFATYEIMRRTACVLASFYLPTDAQFDIGIATGNYIRSTSMYTSIRTTKKGSYIRNYVVKFMIHPAYWLGEDFSKSKFKDIPSALDEIFNVYVNILNPEELVEKQNNKTKQPNSNE